MTKPPRRSLMFGNATALKKPYRPKKVERPEVVNGPARFAFKAEMITRDEYDACLKGNMSVEGYFLKNLNVNRKQAGFAPGLKVKLYPQRGVDKQAHLLLELPWKEQSFP